MTSGRGPEPIPVDNLRAGPPDRLGARLVARPTDPAPVADSHVPTTRTMITMDEKIRVAPLPFSIESPGGGDVPPTKPDVHILVANRLWPSRILAVTAPARACGQP